MNDTSLFDTLMRARQAGWPRLACNRGALMCVSMCVCVCAVSGLEPLTDSYDPILKPRRCPKGFYCPGGRGANKHPCEAPVFNYCPAKCAVATGDPCPQGYACAGGQADKERCLVDPGSYCPTGAISDPAAGVTCPQVRAPTLRRVT